MKTIYEVRWKALWQSLTKYMTIVIISSVVVTLTIRFIKEGLSAEVIFRHLSPVGYVGMFIGIFVFCFLFSGMIAILFKLASITIENGRITGRNYWGFKKTIPLNAIESLNSFSNNGINAVVANGGKYGNVFIYKQTEKFEELIQFIENQMESKNV